MKHIITLAIFFFTSGVFAQSVTSIKIESSVNLLNQKAIIDSLIKKLEEFYIRPNAINNIKNKLNKNYATGLYKNDTSPNQFALKLTTDLIEISKDLHFNVAYNPSWISDQKQSKDLAMQKQLKEEELILAKKNNFGFKHIQILEGNIGYLAFNYFCDPAVASETAVSAMHFLSNTDALIIDLRSNNGGVMEMGQFISSYFFANKELPLYKYYYYDNNRKKIDREMWLLPSVPGKIMENIDIYILTSSATFSAAEWMSYSLQNLKRATIIGEKTAGGAHPVSRKNLTNGFSINIPFGEVKDPITQLDFEGLGVTPNILCKSNEALNIAHLLALNNINIKNGDSLKSIDWIIPIVKNRQKLAVVDSAILKSYQGKYGKGQLKYEDQALYYKWNNAVNFLLIPIAQDLFLVDGIADFRIKIMSKNNLVTGIKRLYENGEERLYKKEY